MNCHAVFNCVGHNHELSDNRLIKETVLKYVNESEFKELFTIAALEKIETVTSSAIKATSSAVKASLDARNTVNDLTAQTLDFISDAINGFNDDIEDVILSLGFITIDSFELGATLTQRNQVLRHAADGKLYRWAGDLPKDVPASSTPTSSGGMGDNAWLEVSDVTLRQELANPDIGAALVARGVVAVDSIADLLALPESARREDLRYLVKEYHPESLRGGGEFSFDPSLPKSRHNGGTCIDPLRSFPTSWSDSVVVQGWFQKSASGVGCWVRLDSDSEVSVESFGAITGDSSIGVQNYHAFRKTLKAALTHFPTKLEGQRRVLFGMGEYFIKGNSPLMFNRTDMTALPGGYRYRRGLSFVGMGRHSTILTLQSSGTGESWFYDTYDPNYPDDNSVADWVTYEGITFRGAEGTTTVAPLFKTSGFQWITHGWEKFMTFNDCKFQYMDTAFHFAGYGNADHNRFFGCQFSSIRDRVFYLNNNQAVANTLVGCDMEEIYGACFLIGPEGGGDITYTSGSIVLYPQIDSDGVPLPNQNTTGFVFWNNSGKTNGPTSGAGQHKFRFKGLRFETYSPKNALVFSYREESTAYGSLDVLFEDCSMVQPHLHGEWVLADEQMGVSIENRADVRFVRCEIRQPYTFRVAEDDGSILFEDCTYYPKFPLTDTQLLASRCSVAGEGMISCRGLKAPPLVIDGSYGSVIVPDFTLGQSSAFSGEAFRQVKHPKSPWPQPGRTGDLKFYFPAGSIITGVGLSKPESTLTAPIINYELKMVGSSGNLLLGTGPRDESHAITTQVSLQEAYIVPQAPNNYITLKSEGTGSSELLPPEGSIYVRYF